MGQGLRVEDLGLRAVANPSTVNFDFGGGSGFGVQSPGFGV